MSRPPATRQAAIWAGVALAVALGAALRLWFIAHVTIFTSDTSLYGDIALSWMQHGVYGFSRPPEEPLPTLIRLPGYPLFLILCFRLFGPEHYRAVVNMQSLIDLLACLLLAALARRLFGARAGLCALFLAALCPFTATYAAVSVAETLTLASIVLAFYALDRWRPPTPIPATASESRPQSPTQLWSPWNPWNPWLWVLSAALACSILLRPDQGLLAAAILPATLLLNPPRPPAESSLRGPHQSLLRRSLPMLAAAACTLLPLVPWTVRNARTFHVFQPLSPRSAADPGETVPTGFYRWYRTWGLDFASTEDVYWNYDGAPIQMADLPRRAFDSPAQYNQTAAVLADYNLTAKPSPEIDDRFNAIAAERIRAHPARYFLELPVARLVNMLLRPRTEMLPVPLAWWHPSEHLGSFALALAYAALNLAYLALGALGLFRWTRRPNRPPSSRAPSVLAWSMIAFIALRCALLLTLDNSEPRYTLEFFPILILAAASLVPSPSPSPASLPKAGPHAGPASYRRSTVVFLSVLIAYLPASTFSL